MKTHEDQDNAPKIVQQKVEKQESAFKDERSETVVQTKLYDMVNRSPQVMQMQSLQSMADNRVQNSPFDIIQKKENKTGLPDNLKSGVENLSGHSMDDVKVHYNSPKPAQLQAHAYAQGTDIHVASGQEKHLPHEAWHVVQQKQGRVKPTMQMKGKVNVNDNSGLEREADVMGAKAVQIEGNSTKTLQRKSIEGGVTQLKLQKTKVHGTTHLVKMVGGSLYSENFESNEGRQLNDGDIIEMETDSAINSRRGPNQEDDALNTLDKTGPQHYAWYSVKSVNQEGIDDSFYIREDTFNDISPDELVKGIGHSSTGSVSILDNANEVLGSDELDSVSGATQRLTGNFGDDWGNNDISDDSISQLDGKSNNGLFSDTGQFFTAGIGGAIGAVTGAMTVMDSDASKLERTAAGFKTAESTATAVNKLAIGSEKAFGLSNYTKDKGEGLSNGATGIQGGGAAFGAVASGLGTVVSGVDTYKKYKEGKKYEAGLAGAETLQGVLGTADKGMKAGHGIYKLATEGSSVMGNATKLTGAASNVSVGLGVAGAGVGIGIGGAQMIKGGYDIYKSGKAKASLKEMEGNAEYSNIIDSDVMKSLTEGQNNKKNEGIQNMVEGGIGVTSGILGIMAITGVGAPFAAAVGIIGGLAIGGYKLYKYVTVTRKQQKVDATVDKFLNTKNETDYTVYLGDESPGFAQYKDTRLKDIEHEKDLAMIGKSEADQKQKSKGWLKKKFSSDDSKKSQKEIDIINRRHDGYNYMDKEQYEAEVSAVSQIYNKSTHAKKMEAHRQAIKAMAMLEQVSGEDKTKLLKILGIKESKFEQNDNNVSTADAEKTKMLADELMKILAQRKEATTPT
jgi:hypothetical protein